MEEVVGVVGVDFVAVGDLLELDHDWRAIGILFKHNNNNNI